ncbi:hypothetical protein DSM112329_00343 [Paraconexibacter sp. AEG42_29]|uniref:Mce/MlaD domain-containing protein n=1 Tax=Paraconexibacter sp. AEG42_29 TaxID=2997339 RepID=A0AAU7APC1_9ACTN
MSRSPANSRLRRPRRDTPSVRRVLLSGLATLAAAAALIALGISSYNGVPGRDYKTVYVDVPKVGYLNVHDPVRIAGVRVGQVKSTDVTADGQAQVKVQLEPDVELPAGTTAAIRANGLLGARYVQLIPAATSGDGATMADGSTIRTREDVLSFGVPETLETLDAGARGGLGTTVDTLGQGMLGSGEQLSRGLHSAALTTTPFFGLRDRLLAPGTQLAELVPSLNRGMTPLDASRRDIAATLPPLADAVQPFIDRRDAVRETLEKAPGALTAADSGLARGRRLLRSADALATAAHRTLPTVPAGLRRTAALLREAPTPLNRTRSLLSEADETVPAVLKLTKAIPPVLPKAEHALKTASPILDELAPSGCDFINLWTTFRSMTGFGINGSGPGGPTMMFRAAVVPSPEVLSGTGGITPKPGTPTRNAYPAPCRFGPSEYPTTTLAGK